MSWYKPADVGFVTRSWLTNLGFGTRLFIRLLATFGSSFKRFGLVRDQIHFLGNYSLVIIAVSGLFVGFVFGLQGYYTLLRFGSTGIYRAKEAVAAPSVMAQLQRWEEAGHVRLPVCMAKTQYSFSTDPALPGAPTGHVVQVREVRLAAGAGFVVAICGDLMTMPGLPRVPAAEGMRLDAEGRVQGLS